MYIKNTIKNAILNKNMIIALLASFICLFIGGFEPLFLYNNSDFAYTFFTSLCCGTSSILALLFPIIACLPYSSSYAEEYNSGFTNYIYLKVSKTKYVFTKILACGISGGIAISFPVLVFFVICILLKGTTLSGYGIANWITHEKQLFVNLPVLYCLGYILNSFLCGFIMALGGLTTSIYAKNKYLIHVIPFLIYIFGAMSMANICIDLNPVTLFDINSYKEATLLNTTIYKISLLIFTGVLFIRGVKIYEK